jgi:hypothetical protein
MFASETKLIFLVVLLFSVARSASRIGVYTSPDCKESSLIGFGWYPYPAYDHVSSLTFRIFRYIIRQFFK